MIRYDTKYIKKARKPYGRQLDTAHGTIKEKNTGKETANRRKPISAEDSVHVRAVKRLMFLIAFDAHCKV